MDGLQFDALIQRLGAARLSRLRVLQGVAGGAAALLAGAALTSEATEAADRRRKRTICHCPDTDPKNCVTLRLRRKRARKHLRQHPNDYKGACAKQPKPVPTCTVEQCAALGQVCCTTGSKVGTCQPNINAC
jgi:hypothetical protein